ncbi:MAG: hypothetical protein M2R46_04409 [Verrucomicrobia subdivision 3 bacterium]|nr:hypothetical protein [Limisphaerales bacterium]
MALNSSLPRNWDLDFPPETMLHFGCDCDLLTIFQRFPDQKACLAHWEQVGWSDEPHCPHCGSGKAARKADNLRIGR